MLDRIAFTAVLFHLFLARSKFSLGISDHAKRNTVLRFLVFFAIGSDDNGKTLLPELLLQIFRSIGHTIARTFRCHDVHALCHSEQGEHEQGNGCDNVSHIMIFLFWLVVLVCHLHEIKQK